MRLIDADAALKWFDEYWAMQKKLGRPSKQQRAIYMTMRTMVNSRKTEDAVPVIRCRDCKRWNTIFDRNKAEFGLCQIRSQLEATRYDEYCSRAERKEE